MTPQTYVETSRPQLYGSIILDVTPPATGTSLLPRTRAFVSDAGFPLPVRLFFLSFAAFTVTPLDFFIQTLTVSDRDTCYESRQSNLEADMGNGAVIITADELVERRALREIRCALIAAGRTEYEIGAMLRAFKEAACEFIESTRSA
jgi:hypothetical protein